MARIFFEDFETDGLGSRYTLDRNEFSDGAGDFLTRTDGSNIGAFYEITGESGDFHYAAMDLDGEGGTGSTVMTFTGIDISGFENLSFSGLFAEDDDGDNQDWDADSALFVSAAIDGGAFVNLLSFQAAGDTNTEPALDTNFDGLGDGTALSSVFETFSAAISGTGSTLDLRIDIQNLDAGDEDISFDALEITGDSTQPAAEADFTLELLHIADQEAGSAAVIDAPNLSAVLNALRAQDLGGDGQPDNTVTLSAGDAFIPGIFYDSSAPVFGSGGIADIQIQNELGIQAIALGNHEFDFGTAELAALIDGSATGNILGADFAGAAFPYLSTNLDFSTDPNMAPLETAGGQAPQAAKVSSSTVLDVNGELLGVVGATTPTLGSISSPGSVGISPTWAGSTPTEAELDALAAVIQAEVDTLLTDNPTMNKVVLLAHMQQISIELGLAERLENVDVIVAGGSNTRLFDDNDRARDGDSDQGQYPTFVTNAGGTETAVVNTDGSYKYVGRLVIDFDADGNIIPTSYDEDISGAYATDAQGVADLNAEGLVDPEIQQIVDAIEAQIIATESNVFGYSEVFLNGNRSGTGEEGDPDGVRTQETNLGNLTADANLAAAQAIDATTVLSIKNGGGIRASIGEVIVPAGGSEAVRSANSEIVDGDGNVIKAEGGISQTDIQTTLAFNNSLALLTLTSQEIVGLLEHGVSALPDVSGRFPQISGVEFSFDVDRPAGSRIVDAEIVDGDGNTIAQLVENGTLVGDGTDTFRIVTLGFLAASRFDDDGNFTGGGDGYPFPNLNTDPSVGEVGDAAVIARVNFMDLEQEGVQTGDATFADDGTEQDALAEYLDDTYGTPETAFDMEDTGADADTRIEQVAFDESSAPEGTGEITLERIGAFDSGSGSGGSEVVAVDAATARMFTTNGEDDRIDVSDISDPTAPVFVSSIDLSTSVADYDGIQSVAVNGTVGAAAVAREGADGEPLPGAIVLFDLATLDVTATVEVGYLPDMVTFTPDGTKILVANEGEPGDLADVPGSVSIIDVATNTVTNVGFEAFDASATALRAAGVRIFPNGEGGLIAPSLDFEPEYITVAPDGMTAFVSLQEANAVAVLDIASGSFTSILPLGTSDHSQDGFGLDASDRDGAINIQNWPILGMHMPDAIASFEVGGTTYFATANEGDARDSDERVKNVTLDPTAFPDASIQDDDQLGRYQVSTIDGDTDGDGDIDVLYGYGSRSFSIFDADGNKVFDSGEAFEQIVARERPDLFNEDEGEFDARSDNKGPEPEAITIGEVDGEVYAFIGLERDSGIMVYNISDPAEAKFVQYINTKDQGDIAPETMAFLSAEDSPSGEPLLLVANEDSGTTAVFSIDVAPKLRAISEVQGAGHTSPYAGEVLVVEGVVTAIDPGEGYWLQSVQGDGDASTSEAIFIDERNTDAVAIGDLARVTGTVDERQFDNDLSTTTIDDVTGVEIVSSGNALPDAIVLGASGLLPPTGQIDDDGLTSFDPETDAIDFFESLEGMRITLEAGSEVVGHNRFGEIAVTVNPGSEVRTDNGGLLLGGANGEITDPNPERIIIDDDIYADFGLETPQDVPVVRTGDTLGEVTGVLDYSFGEFKLLAETAPEVTQGDTVEEVSELTAQKFGDLTVATYNVLNLDPTDGDQFAQLAADIVNNLGTPHILGLQEIQDNNGPTDDGTVAADATYQMLIDAIVDAGGPQYAFADSTPEDKQDGGQPGANIRVGFLYDPSAVSLTGTQRIEGDLDPEGAFDADPTPGDGTNEGFAGTRKPLAGTFDFRGEEVTVVVNHFKSKSGDTPLSGNIQPPVEVSETQRIAQAQVVNDYVKGLLDNDADANVIVLGDLNDFEFSDPVLTLKGDELTNLIEMLPEGDRYSYIFNGNSQVLDHILASDALLDGVAVDAVHINADLPVNSVASDHDPILARFDLNDAPVDIQLSVTRMLVNGMPIGTVIGNLTATDPDTGDQFTFSLLDDANGLFGIDGAQLVLAASPDAEMPTSVSATIQVADLDGATYAETFTFPVDLPGNEIIGDDEGGDLGGTDGDDDISAGEGDDVVRPGLGEDRVMLGSGGDDIVAGSDLELDGDTVLGFSAGDAINVTGTRASDADVSFDEATSTLNIGGTEVAIGAGTAGLDGEFLVIRSGTGTRVERVMQIEDRAEGQAVDASAINGMVPGDYLTGGNGQAFTATFGSGTAGFNNFVGYFLRDIATGAIDSVGTLFAASKAASIGDTAQITGVEADQEIGLFLVQNGANRMGSLTGQLGLAEQNGRLYVTENDNLLTDTIVFNSLDKSLNADGIEHVLSGVLPGDSGLTVGFEDLLGGGDMDFQDLTLTLAVTDDSLLV